MFIELSTPVENSVDTYVINSLYVIEHLNELLSPTLSDK